MSLMAPEVAAKQVAPKVPGRKEAGISAFDTADGRLMLGAFKPSQYRKLATCLRALGHDVSLLDQISDWPNVWQHSEAITAALQDIFSLRSAKEWEALLEAADLPVERVVTLDEAILAQQLDQRGYFATSPADPTVTLPLAGFRMTAGGAELHSAPPPLGKDSRDVLAAAGMTDDEIDALFAQGIAK